MNGLRRSLLRVRQGVLVAIAPMVAGLALVVCQVECASAYTVVTISSVAPAGLEKAFIASTTAQFDATVTANPFVANTYQMVLYGNRAGSLPPVFSSSGTYVVQIGTNTHTVYQSSQPINDIYTYGFSNGEEAERKSTLSRINQFQVACSTSPFTITSGTTTYRLTIDTTTCTNVMNYLFSDIYGKSFSDPVPIPVPPWY